MPELRLARVVSIAIAGVVLGILVVVLATSFAALVFIGPLEEHLPKSVGLNLLAAAIVLIVLALRSSLLGAVGTVQDVTAAVLAIPAASVAVRTAPGARFATVLAMIVVSSVGTGLFFYLLGRFRLGDLVRFVPYPVVGGFLAGTGWLLLKGGAGVATGATLSLRALPDWISPAFVARWAPALAFAAVLLVLLRTTRKALAIPVLLIVAVGAFYVVAAATGYSIPELEARGWLLGPFPSGAARQPFAFTEIGRADWSAVAAEAPAFATVLLLGVLALLLNASGIELAVRRDVDLNEELRAAGTANILMGAVGGMPGYHGLSLSVLADTMGAASRLVGVVAGAVVVLTLVFGAAALSLFPRPALAGLIMLLGLSFLFEWVVDAWTRLRRIEYGVVLLILVVVAAAGFLPGIGVGIALTVVLFLVDYSRTEVVKHTLSSAVYQSNVDRAPEQRQVLRVAGERVQILQLQGFLFFGTAHRLLERIRGRVESTEAPRLSFLVLDFRRVTGIDSSAVMSFSKVAQLAEANGFTLVVTGASPSLRASLERGGLETAAGVRYFSDVDRGVGWCEDRVLEAEDAHRATTGEGLVRALPATHRARLREYLERLELPEGREVITQGEESDDLYLLESGRLAAVLLRDGGEPLRVRSMGPGTVVGEVTLYLGTRRSATVLTEAPSVVYRLSRASFERMEREAPEVAAAFHRELARLLAERVSDTNRTLRAVMD